MPLPIIISGAITVFKVTGAIYLYAGPYFYPQELPALADEAQTIINAVQADADALVIATAERVSQDEEKTIQADERMDDTLNRFDSGLTSMERSTTTLNGVVISAMTPSAEPQHEVLQSLREAQATIQADMGAIAASLETLPVLLKAHRDKAVLRIEKEAYALRAEKLLVLLKEKNLENEALNTKIDALEEKVSGYASRVKTVLAFAKEQQREANALRQQLNNNDADEPNTSTSPARNFFSS